MELESHPMTDTHAWQRTAQTRDGTDYLIRPIRPDDRQREQAFVAVLSEISRYNRMMGTLRELSPALLERFVHVDYRKNMALVATVRDVSGEHIIGVARYAACGPASEAEFAVTVADAWQSRGVGTELMRLLIEYAAGQGLTRLYGTVLASNTRMLQLARRVGIQTRASSEDTRIVEAWYDLGSGDPNTYRPG